MGMDKLIEQIKKSMRISHNKLDDILKSDIKAGTLDLFISGVNPFVIEGESKEKTVKEDALLHKALELYCKWQEDFQGKAEQYAKCYESLKKAMSLSGEYHEG